MIERESGKERVAVLKRLREEHKETVERTQAELKQQQAFRRQLQAVLKEGPRTIPEIASQAQLPAEQVLWHVMAMKKYDLVREAGKDGEYYRYGLAEGEAK